MACGLCGGVCGRPQSVCELHGGYRLRQGRSLGGGLAWHLGRRDRGGDGRCEARGDRGLSGARQGVARRGEAGLRDRSPDGDEDCRREPVRDARGRNLLVGVLGVVLRFAACGLDGRASRRGEVLRQFLPHGVHARPAALVRFPRTGGGRAGDRAGGQVQGGARFRLRGRQGA